MIAIGSTSVLWQLFVEIFAGVLVFIGSALVIARDASFELMRRLRDALRRRSAGSASLPDGPKSD
jgi:hypothetical protein